jgi:hypothetical protein
MRIMEKVLHGTCSYGTPASWYFGQSWFDHLRVFMKLIEKQGMLALTFADKQTIKY